MGHLPKPISVPYPAASSHGATVTGNPNTHPNVTAASTAATLSQSRSIGSCDPLRVLT
ncbi:hypothetical protein [Thiomonas sp.]